MPRAHLLLLSDVSIFCRGTDAKTVCFVSFEDLKCVILSDNCCQNEVGLRLVYSRFAVRVEVERALVFEFWSSNHQETLYYDYDNYKCMLNGVQ